MEPDAERRHRHWFRSQVLPLEPLLRDYVRKISPRDIDIDDLTHDVLVKIYTSKNWSSINNPIAFCRTIARNLVYDNLRRRRVVQFLSFSDLDFSGLMDETPDAEVSLIGRDDFRRLIAVASVLPQQCGKVFILHKVYGFSATEIAAQLSITVSTVEKHLAKALKRCLEALSEDFYGVSTAKNTDGRQRRVEPKAG